MTLLRLIVAGAVCYAVACGGASKSKRTVAETEAEPLARQQPADTTSVPQHETPRMPFALDAASYFGGADADVVDDMALDATGAVYVAITSRAADGVRTGTVMKLDAALTAAAWKQHFPGPVKLVLAPDGALVVGVTTDADLPTTPGALQPARNPGGVSGVDVYLTKLSVHDGSPLWATYLGGSNRDTLTALTVAPNGDIYLAGEALMFPVTAGAYQTTFAGWAVPAYVAAVSADGTQLLAATYLSGNQNGYETPTAVAANGQAVVVAGYTSGSDFPATAGAYQTTTPRPGANFLAGLNPDLTALAFATYLGTAPQPLRMTVAFGEGQDAYVAGSGLDTGCNASPLAAGFVMRFDWKTGALTPALCLAADVNVYAHGLARDETGNVFVSGDFAAVATAPVETTGLPLTGDAFDSTFSSSESFLGVFTADGRVMYFSYLGATRADFSTGLVRGSDGAIYVRGRTASYDFPVTPGAYQTKFSAPSIAWAEEGYVARLLPVE